MSDSRKRSIDNVLMHFDAPGLTVFLGQISVPKGVRPEWPEPHLAKHHVSQGVFRSITVVPGLIPDQIRGSVGSS